MVYVDPKETIDEQEKMIMKNNEDGDRHDTEERRVAEITTDLFFTDKNQHAGKQRQRVRRFPS